MRRWVYHLLQFALIGGGTWILLYNLFGKAEPDYSMVAKTGLLLLVYIIRCISVWSREKKEVRETNEQMYPQILRDAFAGEPRKYARLMRAIERYNRDQITQAKKDLQTLAGVCKTANEEFAVKFFLSACYDETEEYTEQIRILEELLEREPDNALLWTNLGAALGNQGEWQKAMDACHRALRYNAENVEAYTSLALSYMRLGDPAEAGKAVAKALEYDPGRQEVLRVAYAIALVSGKQDMADAYHKQYIGQGGSEDELDMTVAWLEVN